MDLDVYRRNCTYLYYIKMHKYIQLFTATVLVLWISPTRTCEMLRFPKNCNEHYFTIPVEVYNKIEELNIGIPPYWNYNRNFLWSSNLVQWSTQPLVWLWLPYGRFICLLLKLKCCTFGSICMDPGVWINFHHFQTSKNGSNCI